MLRQEITIFSNMGLTALQEVGGNISLSMLQHYTISEIVIAAITPVIAAAEIVIESKRREL